MGPLPLFFYNAELKQGAEISPDEPTARHIVQVLRMQPGTHVQFTDGTGNMATCVITVADKKKCFARVEEVVFEKQAEPKFHLCIAFTKNTARNEWLLEKATELGVTSIIPLISTRTERERTRFDRWRNILVAAILQSRQSYLPYLAEAMQVKDVLKNYNEVPGKLIAHCITDMERKPLSEMLKPGVETILMIGPEGDFTQDEVNLCTAQGFRGVSLGTNRLRTETAAMAACAYFNLVNHG